MNKTIKLRVPSVPNFILEEQEPGLRQEGLKEKRGYSIADFTDKELMLIGKEWTDALLKRAAEIRKQKQPA